jgi:hypothetical protein
MQTIAVRTTCPAMQETGLGIGNSACLGESAPGRLFPAVSAGADRRQFVDTPLGVPIIFFAYRE